MKKRLAIITCIAMIFTLLPSFAMAAEKAQNGDTSRQQISEITIDKAVEPQLKNGVECNAKMLNDISKKIKISPNKDMYWDENYNYIQIVRPEWRETIYQGEVLWTDYLQADTYSSVYTTPFEVLWYGDDPIWAMTYGVVVTPNSYDEWTGQVDIDSKNLPPGEYDFMVLNAPSDSDGNLVDGWLDNYNVPYDYMTVILKKFNAPTNLKATAGSKKVTISYKKPAGATKFKIYRSTKKSSGYKCIKTTTKTKFVDKKVKKGKRYYYKVKAVRKAANKNTIYSKFTSPKRTATVK